jgi:hypothetical protein
MPAEFVIEKAVADESKARPYRWLIVLVSTFSAFLLSLLYLISIANFAELKKKINQQLNSQSQN